jgi:hypothetical protein
MRMHHLHKVMRLAIFFLCMATTSFAQTYGIRNISVLTFSGYTFSDQVDFSGGYGKVDDGFQWGVGLEAGLRESKAVGFVYQRMDTRAHLQGSVYGESARIAFNYFMASGTHYQSVGRGMANVFLAVDVGAAKIDAKDAPNVNFSRFAWGARLGASGGDRLQGRVYVQLYSTVRSSGAGFYFGSSGSGVTVNGNSSLYLFHIGAGVSYRLQE